MWDNIRKAMIWIYLKKLSRNEYQFRVSIIDYYSQLISTVGVRIDTNKKLLVANISIRMSISAT